MIIIIIIIIIIIKSEPSIIINYHCRRPPPPPPCRRRRCHFYYHHDCQHHRHHHHNHFQSSSSSFSNIINNNVFVNINSRTSSSSSSIIIRPTYTCPPGAQTIFHKRCWPRFFSTLRFSHSSRCWCRNSERLKSHHYRCILEDGWVLPEPKVSKLQTKISTGVVTTTGNLSFLGAKRGQLGTGAAVCYQERVGLVVWNPEIPKYQAMLPNKAIYSSFHWIYHKYN